MVSGIIAFLEARIGILRWVALAAVGATCFWTGWTLQAKKCQDKELERVNNTIAEVGNATKTRNKVASMPSPDITGELRKWRRD